MMRNILKSLVLVSILTQSAFAGNPGELAEVAETTTIPSKAKSWEGPALSTKLMVGGLATFFLSYLVGRKAGYKNKTSMWGATAVVVLLGSQAKLYFTKKQGANS